MSAADTQPLPENVEDLVMAEEFLWAPFMQARTDVARTAAITNAMEQLLLTSQVQQGELWAMINWLIWRLRDVETS